MPEKCNRADAHVNSQRLWKYTQDLFSIKPDRVLALWEKLYTVSQAKLRSCLPKKTSLQITTPENLDNNEDSKRDLHRSNLHGK